MNPDLRRRLADKAIWAVVWKYPPAVYDERRAKQPNRAEVWGGGGPTGGRLIRDGLTLAQAEAVAAIINDGVGYGG